MTVQEFSVQVEKEYGPEVAERFRKRFSLPEDEITVTEAMEACDLAILNGQAPIAPAFGRTNSRNYVPMVVPPEVRAFIEKRKEELGTKQE